MSGGFLATCSHEGRESGNKYGSNKSLNDGGGRDLFYYCCLPQFTGKDQRWGWSKTPSSLPKKQQFVG